MSTRFTRRPHPLYLMMMMLGGSFISFWAAVFFIDSQETMQQLVNTEGLLAIFLWRFLGFSLLGCLAAIGIGGVSWAGTRLGVGKKWAKPKRVFQLALVSQVACAFSGALLFIVAWMTKWF